MPTSSTQSAPSGRSERPVLGEPGDGPHGWSWRGIVFADATDRPERCPSFAGRKDTDLRAVQLGHRSLPHAIARNALSGRGGSAFAILFAPVAGDVSTVRSPFHKTPLMASAAGCSGASWLGIEPRSFAHGPDSLAPREWPPASQRSRDGGSSPLDHRQRYRWHQRDRQQAERQRSEIEPDGFHRGVRIDLANRAGDVAPDTHWWAIIYLTHHGFDVG